MNLGIARYPVNETLTSQINLPGVDIRDYPNEDNHTVYGTCTPRAPVVCPKCQYRAVSHGYEDARTIMDVIDDQLITLVIEKQRFQCTECGKSVTYQPEFIDGSESVTIRAKDWIARQCLTMSPRKVSALVGNKVTISSIKNYFSHWCENQYEAYISRLSPSPQIGIHTVTDNDTTYIALTDLKDSRLIDVYDKSDDPSPCLYLMAQLAISQVVREVCSSIDITAMAHARGMFAHSVYSTGHSQFLPTEISAALCSIHTELVHTISDSLNAVKPATKKQIMEIVSIPIWEPVTSRAYNHINHLLIKLDTIEPRLLVQLECNVRECLENEILSKKCYDDMVTFFDRHFRATTSRPVKSMLSRLTDSATEINLGFSKPFLQQQFQEIDCTLADIIRSNRKCSFNILRARLLFSFFDQDLIPGYTGISLQKLKTLGDYDT